mmetsp:Transcript_35475/g.52922  ORF Transcript_35475/g.52922 Transcript_35475/m.52922 type:complete len:516 (-) Transcript_35475:344-1891(-)
MVSSETEIKGRRAKLVYDAKMTLRWVALCLGELRDGLTMINMQSAFLIAAKNYTEKQVGVMFFVFGMSQFLFQAPAGYLFDYTDKKIQALAAACIATTFLTLLTAATAEEDGANIGFMIVIKFIQGAVTALIPPGLNSISQGIVGSVGMTKQVSMNEMMNHFGTALIVLSGSLMAYFLYPEIGSLFAVSAIACTGVLVFLSMIKPEAIDHNAARGLTETSAAADDQSLGSLSKYQLTNTDGSIPGVDKPKDQIQTKPSFNFGFGGQQTNAAVSGPKADTPLQVLRDPTLLTFIVLCFLFHTANGTILPLVMQTLAIGEGRIGILFSGLCIIVAQVIMVGSAKICGDYSSLYGRKPLFLVGLFSVSIRCVILVILITIRDSSGSSHLIQIAILSTQLLDGIGAGFFGTMYILVTSDISRGTGRFSMTLGLTTAAMSIGGTVSGYLGQALAQDLGYKQAFVILGVMSLVPALLYLFCIPETYIPPELSAMGSIQEGDEEEHDKTVGDTAAAVKSEMV